MTATVLIPEKGYWEINRGFISKPDNIVVDDSSVFYWASVGKLVTSTLIHKLIEEDKLSLDDKLSKWYPDIENAKKNND
ncbi:serine hydrolase [Zobellia nedashkovskayae]